MLIRFVCYNNYKTIIISIQIVDLVFFFLFEYKRLIQLEKNNSFGFLDDF